MILLAAVALGCLGLVSIVSRPNLLGTLVGSQLIALGASLFFVVAGISSGAAVSGHIFGIFIVFSGITQLVAGYAIAIRTFYLKKDIDMDGLRTLKR